MCSIYSDLLQQRLLFSVAVVSFKWWFKTVFHDVPYKADIFPIDSTTFQPYEKNRRKELGFSFEGTTTPEYFFGAPMDIGKLSIFRSLSLSWKKWSLNISEMKKLVFLCFFLHHSRFREHHIWYWKGYFTVEKIWKKSEVWMQPSRTSNWTPKMSPGKCRLGMSAYWCWCSIEIYTVVEQDVLPNLADAFPIWTYLVLSVAPKNFRFLKHQWSIVKHSETCKLKICLTSDAYPPNIFDFCCDSTNLPNI